MAAEVWIVAVHIDMEDDEHFGPYTETQARRIAARLQAEAEACTTETGMNHHPRSVAGALAWKLERWEDFMTGEEKRTARREVRAANKEAQDNLEREVEV